MFKRGLDRKYDVDKDSWIWVAQEFYMCHGKRAFKKLVSDHFPQIVMRNSTEQRHVTPKALISIIYNSVPAEWLVTIIKSCHCTCFAFFSFALNPTSLIIYNFCDTIKARFVNEVVHCLTTNDEFAAIAEQFKKKWIFHTVVVTRSPWTEYDTTTWRPYLEIDRPCSKKYSWGLD